jgi:tartrate dehydratase alpha subunit/fumarate hydratase class I-like protein
MENKVLELSRKMGIGAQFGGKYFCHDVRVVRLPRHGASCPVGIGVSCSADRQVSLAMALLFIGFCQAAEFCSQIYHLLS